MLIHGRPELLEEEILAYADLEPANTLPTLRTTIKMKGVIKEHWLWDLIYNYSFLNKKREKHRGAKNQDEMDEMVKHLSLEQEEHMIFIEL
jgi:hypothetical protein